MQVSFHPAFDYIPTRNIWFIFIFKYPPLCHDIPVVCPTSIQLKQQILNNSDRNKKTRWTNKKGVPQIEVFRRSGGRFSNVKHGICFRYYTKSIYIIIRKIKRTEQQQRTVTCTHTYTHIKRTNTHNIAENNTRIYKVVAQIHVKGILFRRKTEGRTDGRLLVEWLDWKLLL